MRGNITIHRQTFGKGYTKQNTYYAGIKIFLSPKGMGETVAERSNLWYDNNDKLLTFVEIANLIRPYVLTGCKIYIGSDSMLTNKGCVFATVICLHGVEQKVAIYYFNKFRSKEERYKNLRQKIMREVKLSLETACNLREYFPEEQIEIHADVGLSQASATSIYVDQVKGWVAGLGFTCKIKPKSWASSTVADWHTK